jgi:hypothetical protein
VSAVRRADELYRLDRRIAEVELKLGEAKALLIHLTERNLPTSTAAVLIDSICDVLSILAAQRLDLVAHAGRGQRDVLH